MGVEDLIGEFSVWALFGSLLFSTIGLWLWRQAKNRENGTLQLIAAFLVLYSYFTPDAKWTWGIGILLCTAANFYW